MLRLLDVVSPRFVQLQPNSAPPGCLVWHKKKELVSFEGHNVRAGHHLGVVCSSPPELVLGFLNGGAILAHDNVGIPQNTLHGSGHQFESGDLPTCLW